jgi:hypothetical protein
MNRILALFCLVLAAGCSAPSYSRYDEFEKVQVDKLVGNEARASLLSRSVVCLNPMREMRWLDAATNITVSLQTNLVTVATTNLTVNSSSNQQLNSNTNVVAALPALNLAEAGAETPTNAPAVVSPDSSNAGITLSTTRNESIATAPNQLVISRSFQKVTQSNAQNTVNTNSQSVTAGTGQITTVETNYTITFVTNQVVVPVTNVVVRAPNQPAYDYFLFTEIAPADFTLASGESLVLLVDGVRYSFAPGQPASNYNPRRGFLTTFYRVPAEVMAGIANAQEVKLRIRGASGALERTLSRNSRQNFQEFLVDHFEKQKSRAADRASTDASRLNPS